MNNLFFLYPRVKFDLFHISYPYQGELSVLAKLFPNVYVDFCWAHIVSPSVSRRTLHEFLEMVPVNKILASAAITAIPNSATLISRWRGGM